MVWRKGMSNLKKVPRRYSMGSPKEEKSGGTVEWSFMLKVSSFRKGFWGRRFPPKNKPKQVDLSYHSSKSNLFVRFLEELDDPKKSFRN